MGLWIALALALATALLGARWRPAPRRADGLNASLAALLASRYGLTVSPAEVVVSGGAPRHAWDALSFRHLFFLGRRRPGAPRDLFWALARATPAGVALSVRALVNLSNTPSADEGTFVVSGSRVAYPLSSRRGVVGIAVVDVSGLSPRATRGLSLVRRVTTGITNLQETGHWSGLERHLLEPRRPLHAARLRWLDPDRLEIRGVDEQDGAQHTAVLDVERRRLAGDGGAYAYRAPVLGTKPLFNWLVDTVRALPFVGPKRIEQAEVLVFSVRDWLRRRLGGTAIGGVRAVSTRDAAATMASDEEPYQPRPGALRAPGWPPAPLRPILPNPHPNEGRWLAVPRSIIQYTDGAPPPLLTTFIHPDPRRRYAGVGVLLWDPRQVALGMVGGTKDPESTTGLAGRGVIPRDARLERVIAAFNGGFQTLHGEWGMMAEGRLIREPARWAATVATDRSGGLIFGTWEAASSEVPSDLLSFRQNLAPLLEDGVVNPLRNLYWGLAVRSQREKIHIVRSALCLTREGFGAYLWGKAVSLATLTRAMQMTRCQYGMQMDINRTNASLEFYRFARRAAVRTRVPKHHATGGRSTFGPVPGARDWVFWARLWLPEMYTASFPRYIRRAWRDFMYLSRKPILPGPPLSSPVQPARPGEGRWIPYAPPGRQPPFPPVAVLTELRPDPGHPQVSVTVVKMDPRHIEVRARAVPSDAAASSSAPRCPDSLAVLRFGERPSEAQEGLRALPVLVRVGDRSLGRAPSPDLRYVWVAGYPDSETAPTAGAGPRPPSPQTRDVRLLVGGPPLDASPGRSARPALPTDATTAAAAAGSGRRASALAVDDAGHLCYAVGPASPLAARHLLEVMRLAGCRDAIRLPDRAGGGPLALGPHRGRLRLLPGDRRSVKAPGLRICLGHHPRPAARRLPKMRVRPDQVRFSISRKEALRVYRQRKRHVQ